MPRAQYALARMYRRGEGVPQDHAEAARWYRQAAQQGLAHAQSDLGVLYETGRGVARDYAEAVAGIARPPNRTTRARRTTSASCTNAAMACRATTSRR